MELSKYLVSLVVFGLFMAVMGGLITSMASKYGDTEGITETIGEYQTLNETSALSENMRKKVENSEVSETNWFETFVKGGWQALNQVWNSLNTVFRLITKAVQDLGLPAYFITASISVIVLLIVFAVLRAVFKRDVL